MNVSSNNSAKSNLVIITIHISVIIMVKISCYIYYIDMKRTDGLSSTSRGRHLPKMDPPESAFDIKEYSIKKHQKRIPVCIICKKSFPSWTEQAEHWKWKHRNKDLYTCKT